MVAEHLPVEIFSTTSGSSNRPEASVILPDDYKLLSGGAFIDETENGSLFLTASFPDSNNRWRAMGKAHLVDQSAPLTVYAMALHDPDDIWEVKIFKRKSASPVAHPQDFAYIDDGTYELVGGGAQVDYGAGEGNLLTASYPLGRYWRSDSKDHSSVGTPSPATITTYAIGLRSRLPEVSLVSNITDSSSQRQAHPSAHASPASGYTMVGGGARVNYTGGGNLLAASYPLDSNKWKASSKDLVVSDPATIDAFALGITVMTV